MKLTTAILLAVVSLSAFSAEPDDTPLFSTANLVSNAVLTSEEQATYDLWTKSLSFKSVKLTTLNPIYLKDGPVSFVDETGSKKTFQGKSTYNEQTKFYTWFGGDASNHMMFAMKEGHFSGNIYLNGRHLTIRPLGRFYAILEGSDIKLQEGTHAHEKEIK